MWSLLLFCSVTVIIAGVCGETFKCPDGWLASPVPRSCVKVFQQKRSWVDARKMCQAVNADLVRIPNDKMNSFVAGLLNTTGDTKYWIGLHDRVTERTFKWLDDTNKPSYTNWANKQPNNYRSNKGQDQDCAEIGTFTPKWQDDWCYRRSRFICETTFSCPKGWTRSSESGTCLQVYKTKLSWARARAYCKVQSGDLVKILNRAMNTLVVDLINFGEINKDKVWIGLHDRGIEGRFYWLDETQAPSYLNWANAQPNNFRGKQDCVEIGTFSPRWQDDYCMVSARFVCERPPDKQTFPRTTLPSSNKSTTVSSTTKTTPRRVQTSTTVSNTTKTTPRRVQTSTTVSSTTKTTPRRVQTSTTTTTTTTTTTNRTVKTSRKAPAVADWHSAWVMDPKSNSLFKVSSDAQPWSIARAICQHTGGDLVKIRDQEMNDFVAGLIRARGSGSYWLGLQRNQTTTPDSTQVRYENWAPNATSGSGLSSSQGGLTCVQIGPTLPLWQLASCSEQRKFVCEKNAMDHWRPMIIQTSSSVPSTTTTTPHSVQTSVAVPSTTTTTPHSVQTSVAVPSTTTTTPRSVQTSDSVPSTTTTTTRSVQTSLASTNSSTDRIIPQTAQTSTSKTDRVNTTLSGDWSFNPASGTMMRASQDKKTWVDARAVCQTEGGELAEIQDPHTNAFVADLISSNGGGPHWIGLNDRREENRFVWLDKNEEVRYTNWARKQPDNYQNKSNAKSGQDCVEIGTFTLQWQDEVCTTKSKYVCERLPSTTSKPGTNIRCPDGWSASPASGSCVKLYRGEKSWSGGRAVCQAYGGDLVIIHSDAMNTYVAGLISKGESRQFWLGLHDTNGDGKFLWLDSKDKVPYTNWANRQPSSYAQKESKNAKRCAVMGTPDNKWRVDVCSKPSSFVCEMTTRVLPSAHRGGGSGSPPSLIIGIIACVCLVGAGVAAVVTYRRKLTRKPFTSNNTTVSFTNLVDESVYDESSSNV
ncbi:hypothetical protein RRG08_040658 [Elysia crispata]|uniref:C-type lectin domain-containing protein n=1 Tax=Elysia crispata TaxID=231223 RepID=A0AAE1D6E3_9GAST|nr:hypothetical protein RRG08_040658 [Elysia crispata]